MAVLGAQTLAELLTSDKLSELACLTLYLMYEKKNGKKSVWYEFIKVKAVCLLQNYLVCDWCRISNIFMGPRYLLFIAKTTCCMSWPR